MKGSLRTDEGYPSLFLCDEKHDKVASRHVELYQGLTNSVARSATIDLFDRLESQRVFDFNIAIAIFCAQRRIKRKAMLSVNMGVEADILYPLAEDFSVFVQLEALRRGLQSYADMITDIIGNLGPMSRAEPESVMEEGAPKDRACLPPLLHNQDK